MGAPLEEAILDAAGTSCDAAEVLTISSEDNPVTFEHNRLKSIQTVESTGYGLRVIKDGRVGFTSGTKVGDVEAFVARACESARFGEEAKFEFPAAAAPSAVKVFSEEAAGFPTGKAVDIGTGVIEKILAAEPEAQCEFHFEKSRATVRIINSRGLDLQTESTSASFSVGALKVKDSGLLEVYEFDSRRDAALDFDAPVERIIGYIKTSETETGIGTEKLPVIFSSRAVRTLLATFKMGVNGKLVQKGISPLTGKKDTQVVADCISLYDDPSIDYGDASFPFDMEGLATYRKPLFEKGVLENYIFDLETAARLGVQSTANAARGFGSLPSPTVSNLVVTPGETPLAEMLKEMPRGILVEQLLGGGQSNMLAGEFSVNLDLAFLVEKGELRARLKDVMIAGNIFDAFNDIAALGSEARLVGSVSSPPVMFGALNASGKH